MTQNPRRRAPAIAPTTVSAARPRAIPATTATRHGITVKAEKAMRRRRAMPPSGWKATAPSRRMSSSLCLTQVSRSS